MPDREDIVRLRPVEEKDLTVLARFDVDPSLSEPFEWRGFRDARRRRVRWERDGYLGDNDGMFIAALPDGGVAGMLVWRTAGPAPPVGGCFQIGILLLPEHRGRGLGTVAQRLLCEYLFSTTLANRIEASTEVDNVVEQRALEQAGFVREGVMRGRGFVRGEWRDGVLYSRLRDDPSPSEPD